MSTQFKMTHLTSADCHHRIAVYVWQPRGRAAGCLQIIHGMREHMGRYGDFASYLCRQGFAVVGHDHLGHGRSATNGDFGYFGERDGCRHLVRDCHSVTDYIRQEFPQSPLFLLGHSMGSYIGRLYVLQRPHSIRGLVCTGTGGEERLAPVGRVLAEVLARLRGNTAQSELLDRMIFSSYSRRCAGRHSSMDWLSRDGALVESYMEDPLMGPLFTNRGMCDLLTLQMAATSRQWAERVGRDLPILLLAGEEDPVGGYGRGVVQTYERLKLAGCLDVSCKLYPEDRHEILNELDREVVYYDILQWMLTRLDLPPMPA